MDGAESGGWETHQVLNQPPLLVDYNAFRTDAVLVEALRREGAAWAGSTVADFGQAVGSAELIEAGRLANVYAPVLRTHDRHGRRIDQVDYHPAYHQMLRFGVEAQVHAWPRNEPRPGVNVARGALLYLLSQVEAGVCCPITMTFAAAASLARQPDVAGAWLPLINARTYDPRSIPASQKGSALMGMAMTEKQGGSDVRANTTRAVPRERAGPGQVYLLTGHKWFFSAPMSDAFLTLAQAAGGLSCFLVPRITPEGRKNHVFLQRLKDKLGNRSNASSEIEYRDTWAQLIGEEGRGVQVIIDMVVQTRLDCAIGSAGYMRQALAQAVHHAHHRSAFGKKLSEQPLMLNVLADLAIETEAAAVTTLRIARACDAVESDPGQKAFVRLATAVIKYWVCKRGVRQVYESLECLAGAGYVEESMMPRLYREAPLTSIWEGSGNVMCLDVLRALRREPGAADSLLAELDRGRGQDQRLDQLIQSLAEDLRQSEPAESQARRLVERMALALQGALLMQHAPAEVAKAFCRSRLDPDRGHEYGTLPAEIDCRSIVARAAPWL
jgi:putative acyl-CoA dehydrogenase